MGKLRQLRLACIAVLVLFGAGTASAFNTGLFARNSKLATGKWVKITIPESGMYEITYNELRAMGFSDPTKVKVYGQGGYRINEKLVASFYDDVKTVPILRTNNKICFYGKGPVYFSIANYSTLPHYVRTFNPYSQVGCYFLTETTAADPNQTVKSLIDVGSDYINVPTSLNYFCHENELTTVSNSGKEMLGEEITNSKVLIDYNLPNIADSNVVVHTTMAASSTWYGYVNAVLHSGGAADTTVYTASSSRIYSPSEESGEYYNTASPYASLKLTHPAEQGQLEPFVTYPTGADTESDELSVMMAYLDYFILSYTRDNVIIPDQGNQALMSFIRTTGKERFQLPNASSSTVVWTIESNSNPKRVETASYDDASGKGLYFTSSSVAYATYMVFDPAKTLKKISSFEPIENQNLHAIPTPDMLIISAKPYFEQAQRLADMHKAVDGIDVAVVTQEQVFNEFSSGTRDAMAYRLMCKMFYDRDSVKFKNLLLMGTGTFDNREILGEHPNNLLAYESDNSNSRTHSYTCDDFFGMLEDNSGTTLSADKLSIGVGRITCTSEEQARNDVDKIVEYYTTPDYGVWRNNTLVFSDEPDNGEYMFQGEGYKNMIDGSLKTNMHVNTVHNTMYPRSNANMNLAMSRREASEAKQLLAKHLKDGMYFATYVGHSGPMVFTQTSNMWNTADVIGTTYPHWPVMSTACCDVAHYDNDTHGIAELMFHKRNGGAIALMTSCRNVYTTSNDKLNQYFINALFGHATTGQMTTIGQAYKLAKRGFATSDENKLSFFLLGDPALKFNYPVSRFNITLINGTAMVDSTSLASVSPLTRFTVEARVVDAEGNLDTQFNGDATLTLYDKQDLFTNVTHMVNSVSVSRDIYFNRPKLAEVTGRVTNGVFTGTMVAPEQVLAKNETVLLRAYAHKDNTDYMVNGSTTRIKMLPLDEETAIPDAAAPVITAMYLNDPGLSSLGVNVGTSAMLYITATDDQALNVQENQRYGSMSLILDGGKASCSDVNCYLTVGEDGKALSIEYPLNNLSAGQHTLTYTVYDLVGNKATRTVTFMVGSEGATATLVADKWPAYRNEQVNFSLETELPGTPEMTVRVTDATGNLVWMTTTSTFPVAWNMKDMQGNRVPAGLYRYFGTYRDGSSYGGTSISKLIVLDALKTAAK